METPRSRDRETSAFYGPHQGRGFRCLLAANTDKVSALALSTEEYFCGQLDKNSRRAGAGPSLVRAVSLLLRRVASVQCTAQPSPAQPISDQNIDDQLQQQLWSHGEEGQKRSLCVSCDMKPWNVWIIAINN